MPPADPRDPIEAACKAACKSYGNEWDETPETGVGCRSGDPRLPSRQDWREIVTGAIAAYEAAAWCSDMERAPKSNLSGDWKDEPLLVLISNKRRVLGYRDADYEPPDPEYDNEDCEFYDVNGDGIEPAPTHWRLPPAGPVT